MSNNIFFLPETHSQQRVDVLLVTGDAYIDHPSFGIAVIARVLHDAGYSVCIVSQPPYFDRGFLDKLPDVGLFIGITSGNIDSVVNNYTPARHRRSEDVYSVNGATTFPSGEQIRPDRALIPYTSYFKSRYKGVPVVLGGIEASLRRFAHYDYVQDKLRKSALLDSKADIIVYGMGERAILQYAESLRSGKKPEAVSGTAVVPCRDELKALLEDKKTVILPSFDEITHSKEKLLEAVKLIEANMVPGKAEALLQDNGGRYVVSYPFDRLMTAEELDRVYALPFRKDYPEYCEDVPAWRMINTSITSHRGCYGRCSFCAITSHQGPAVVSRSAASILNEAVTLSGKSFFRGTISDVGGPTANMYGSSCRIGYCKDPSCLYPKICENLILDGESYVDILRKVKGLDGVKNVFITSGLRYDIALAERKPSEWLIRECTSGHLKIAPEHVSERVLAQMKKPDHKTFEAFIKFFEDVKRRNNLNYFILPYIILSHPGSDNGAVRELGDFLRQYKISVRQYQDFTPTPQTLSTAMFFSGNGLNGEKINIPHFSSVNNKEREILEGKLRR